MLPEQVGVLDDRALERLENNAALSELICNHIALYELAADENHAAGDFIQPVRSLDNDGTRLLG